MYVYLPIAEASISLPLVLAIGGGVGLLSGMFGVGGGFLMTPLLITLGVPPVVAVATGANQVAGASVSGAMVHWRRGTVDFKMAGVLTAGGLVGAGLGVLLLGWLRRAGQVDLVIALCYAILLGALGLLMLVESALALMPRAAPTRGRLHRHHLLHRLPLRMRFRRSRLYISALLPLGVGLFVGVMTSVMGVGGGFVTVPAMIYLIGMSTEVTVGTSLVQIALVGAGATLLQAITTQAVDALLALLLLVGGTIGAQMGARLSRLLRGEQLRFLLALIVLAVGVRVAVTLIEAPNDPYSATIVAPHDPSPPPPDTGRWRSKDNRD